MEEAKEPEEYNIVNNNIEMREAIQDGRNISFDC
jgi:hypothetical protein